MFKLSTFFFLRSFARFCARFALFCARFALPLRCNKVITAEYLSYSLASCEAIVVLQQFSITCCFLQELLSEGLHCSQPTVWNHRLWVIHHITKNRYHVSIQPGILEWQGFKQFPVRHLHIRIILGPYKPQKPMHAAT